MISKDRLTASFGTSLGIALFAFGLASFPLAVYGVHVLANIGWFLAFAALCAFYVLIPFSELASLGLAVFGLFHLL